MRENNMFCCMLFIAQETDSGAKNELLFSQFSMNYNSLPEMFRKGSVLIWSRSAAAHGESVPTEADCSSQSTTAREQTATDSTLIPHAESRQARRTVVTLHEDIIGEPFWTKHTNILL